MSIQDERNWQQEAATEIHRCIDRYRRNNNGEVPSAKEIAQEAAQRIRDRDTILALRDTEKLWAYHDEDGLWHPDGKQRVRFILDTALEAQFSKHLLSEVCEKIRAHCLYDRDDLGVPAGTVAVENGLLTLDTGEVRPLEQSDYATWRLPVSYDRDATCPRFIEFLEEVCAEASIPVLQEYIGYCLDFQGTNRKKALMLLGPTDAGKSVFLNVIHALFGDDSVAGVSPQFLADERWGVDKLKHKPVNIRHDLDTRKIKRPGPLKELIAGNPMMAEQKYHDPYEITPKTKLLYAANRAPEVDNAGSAFWNRWLTIRFPNRIPPAKQDPALSEKMKSELSGILNWALEGYRHLEKRGEFSHRLSAETNKRRWRAYGSSVDRFVVSRLNITGDRNHDELKQTVYDAYLAFAGENDLDRETKTKFTRDLKTWDHIDDGKRRVDGENPRPVYIGVQLKDTA